MYTKALAVFCTVFGIITLLVLFSGQAREEATLAFKFMANLETFSAHIYMTDGSIFYMYELFDGG